MFNKTNYPVFFPKGKILQAVYHAKYICTICVNNENDCGLFVLQVKCCSAFRLAIQHIHPQ
jgi:hypothetical protein